MAVRVVARGEESKKRLAARGITAGKIKSGSRTRSSSGTTTTRSASGEVEKIEEPVRIDPESGEQVSSGGVAGVKTTTFNKEPLGAAANEQEAQRVFLNPETGQPLSPYESFAIESTEGGRTNIDGSESFVSYQPPKKSNSIFNEDFRRSYPYYAAEQEALNQERIYAPSYAAVRKGINRKVFEQRTDESIKQRLTSPSSEQDFQEALKSSRSFNKQQLLSAEASYGDIKGNIFQRTAAAFSLGGKTIGGATESLLFEQEAKLKQRNKEKKGSSNIYAVNVLKDSSRDAAVTGLKVARNVIGGGVTDLGKSKVQAAVFVASFGLGSVVGVAKGTGVARKVGTAAKQTLFTRTAVKGTTIGLKTVGYGALATSTVIAAKKGGVEGVSRLAGQVLSYSAAFKTGEAGGFSVGLGIRQTAPQISKTLQILGERVSDATSQPLGTKGAVYKGSRRVSPKSKVEISKQNRGIQPKQKKGVRYSTDKGTSITKVTNKDVKRLYEQQLGSKVKEVRFKKDTLTGGNKRVEVIPKPRGDFVRVEYAKGGFRKPVKVSRPTVYTKGDTLGTTTVKSGSQQLKKITVFKNVPSDQRLQKPVVVRLNDQKQFLRGNPATSRYAAQNIRSDPLKIDLGSAPASSTSQTRGFRSGVSKTSILGQERITYLNSGLRDLTGASLPAGNYASTLPPRTVATSVAASSNLIIAAPINIEESAFSTTTIQATPSKIAQGSTSVTAVASTQVFKEETTPKIGSVIDTAKSLSVSTGAGGGKVLGESSPSPSVFPSPPVAPPSPPPPTFNPITTPAPVQKRPNTPPPSLLFPRRLNQERERIGFNVLVRKQGVFSPISTKSFSKKEALAFGSFKVGSTPAASFKIERSSSPVTSRFFGTSMLKDFDKRSDGIYVEKDEKRINTLGELAGITRKGQLALRTRRVFK
jgi:hypothetical protein